MAMQHHSAEYDPPSSLNEGSGDMSRRAVLFSGAAASLVAAVGATAGISAPLYKPKIIDTHHHLFPPAFIAKRRWGLNAPGQEHVLQWTPQASLDEMDRAGVSKAIVSISLPSVWARAADKGEALDLARECNDFAARMRQDHPTRFGFFTTVPLPYIEGTLGELTRCLDQLGASGAVFMTNYDGRYLGDPAFDPVLSELNRRKAPTYVHPMAAPCCTNLNPGLPASALEYGFETTRTIASLLYSGAFAKYPDIKWLFSHGGGALPVLADRLSSFAENKPDLLHRIAPRGMHYELARHYYDTASAANAPQMAALMRFAGVGHILYGTDYPYLTMAKPLQQLRALVPDNRDYDRIVSANAIGIFGE